MFNLPTYQQRLADVNNAVTVNEKGDAFEALAEYLFENINGVIVQGRDALMDAEEIDLVLWNAKTEECLYPFDNVIIVECKNWSRPVGAPALDNFIGKIRRRKLQTGIFIAANGVTGDFLNGQNGDGAISIIKSALQEGIRVIVINKDDLDNITSINDLHNLIIKRYCGLFIHKIFNN